jgi:hypothetical protein
MITGRWQPHANPLETVSQTVDQIVNDIADRAIGGYDDFTDDASTYPQYIVAYYTSDDCPEPLNTQDYQLVMQQHYERVKRAILMRIRERIY